MRDILLVEDELMISEPFRIILSSAGYSVDVAANGLEALELCGKNKYRLILLDLMMPVCNGYEFLERFQPKTKTNTNIILMTNLSGVNEIKEALSLGAKKSLLKANMTPSILITHVEEELGRPQK